MAAAAPRLALLKQDAYLAPYAGTLQAWHQGARSTWARLEAHYGTGLAPARRYRYLGCNPGTHEGRAGTWYREWAPGAEALWLEGDFNGWRPHGLPMTRVGDGIWEIFWPTDGEGPRHGDHFKVRVRAAGQERLRLPAYLKRAVQDPHTLAFAGQFWAPPQPYTWRHPRPARQWAPRIYEAHAGMALEAEKVSSFSEFTAQVLPRIVAAGYNAIQLMAVQEHPYYGSFGYHVSNLYAVSSRFGTPEELKALIDAAHGSGLAVYLDLVHSHMVKNVDEGLNGFDGTDYQYFHAGGRGQHPAWDSLLYDYAKDEVLSFLLSNVAWWLEEYHFDGLRFDGVTSMLYQDHGLGREFHEYAQYFDPANRDDDAVIYLKLANRVAHKLLPGRVVTIAEEVSGMPGLCRPLAEGGFGFDFRLAMGLPDYWIKLLKEKRDEDWSMAELYHTMMNRRLDEGHIAYVESHDQALVGDKTIAFRLMDADMYWHMSRLQPRHPVIDRGLALHKVIRLLTFSLGGNGWLNFIGNEFGHPEWIDFPRAGNGHSYRYARRQWSLVDNSDLRYRDLGAWDQAMQALATDWHLLRDGFIEQLFVDEEAKVLVYRRGPLVFAANWHPTESQRDYRIPVPDPDDYQVLLDSDAPAFSGFGRTVAGQVYWRQDQALAGRQQSLQVYLPARTVQVLAPVPMVRDPGLRPSFD